MSTLYKSVLCIFKWMSLMFSMTDASRDLCPWGTHHIKSGNQCLLQLKLRGDYVTNKKACENRNATLLSFKTVDNLLEVCQYLLELQDRDGYYAAFLGADQDAQDVTQYIWHYNNKTVNLPMKYWYDQEFTGLRCLEIFSFGADFCRINDIICEKDSEYSLCQFLHPDPCLENNGGCEDICVPRGLRTRTCKCKSGFLSNGTNCVSKVAYVPETQCPDGYKLFPNFHKAGKCLKLLEGSLKRFKAGKTKCENEGGHFLALDEKNTMKDITELEKFFPVQRAGTTDGLIGYWLNVDPVSKVWEYDRSNLSHTFEQCSNDVGLKHDPYVLLCDTFDCCVFQQGGGRKKHNAICQRQSKNVTQQCTNNKRGCKLECKTNRGGERVCECERGFTYSNVDNNCVDINECEVDNGGCHHNCNNVVGSFECSCKPKFQLNETYNTECDDLDECHFQNGGCGDHMCVNDWQNPVSCECKKGYDLVNGITCIQNINSVDNSSAETKTSKVIYKIGNFEISRSQLNWVWIAPALLIISLIFVASAWRARQVRRGRDQVQAIRVSRQNKQIQRASVLSRQNDQIPLGRQSGQVQGMRFSRKNEHLQRHTLLGRQNEHVEQNNRSSRQREQDEGATNTSQQVEGIKHARHPSQQNQVQYNHPSRQNEVQYNHPSRQNEVLPENRHIGQNKPRFQVV